MTFEQITPRIRAAAEAQDLPALLEASKQRQAAVAMLPSMTPTPELRDAVAASIAAGEEARRAIRAIQQRLRKDSRRLTNIEHGFLRTLVPTKHQIDCKG
jgi:hypothetical protein